MIGPQNANTLMREIMPFLRAQDRTAWSGLILDYNEVEPTLVAESLNSPSSSYSSPVCRIGEESCQQPQGLKVAMTLLKSRENDPQEYIRRISCNSFILSGHFYSAPSSPLLLRGDPDYSTDTVSEFHAEAHRQL